MPRAVYAGHSMLFRHRSEQMVSAYDSLQQQEPLSDNASSPLMKAHIVNQNDIFYKKGRLLAEERYREVWEINSLADDNDCAVVISEQGSVIGNMNVQLRREGMPLKSETFFGKEHWRPYFTASTSNIADISSLAISDNLRTKIRRPTMMMLILGVQSLGRLLGINHFVAIQHEFLIRILKKSLHLPFFRNNLITAPLGDIPDDRYWNRGKPPRIYYLNANNRQVIDTCCSFFCYLNVAGIQTSFLPRLKQDNLPYAAFKKNWHRDKEQVAIPESIH